MKKNTVVFLLAALAASFSAFASDNILIHDSDGTVVTLEMLQEEFRHRSAEEKPFLLGNPEAKNDIINTLFRREKLLRRAREMDISSDPEVQYKLRMAEKDVLILAARERYMESLEMPSFDALAREKYLKDKETYAVKEQVKASHIYLSADNDRLKEQRLPEMQALMERLNKGESFEDLAKEYSEDSSASKGGDLGWFARGRMVKPFEDAAFKLNPGEMSDIVQSKFGLHIIKLVDKKEGRILPFEEVAEQIKTELRNSYIKEKTRTWFSETTSAIKPEINQDLIDSIDLSAFE